MVAIKNKARKAGQRISSKPEDICSLDWVKADNNPLAVSDKGGTKTLSIVDLFCGCGGMTLGIAEGSRINGFNLDIKLALDINKASLEVYNKNFLVNKDRILEDNITKIVTNKSGSKFSASELTLKQKYKELDILVAGPPCQGHSNLNNHTRRNDPRNELYLNAIRFIEIVKPKVAIIENVTAVVHDKDNVIAISNKRLEKSGYQIHPLNIDMSAYGLAQSRKRYIQIAILGGNLKEVSLEEYKVKSPIPLSDFISDILEEPFEKDGIFYTPSRSSIENRARIDYLFSNDAYDLPNKLRPNCHKNKQHSYVSNYGRMFWDKPAQTITSGFGSIGQGRYLHPLRKRVITPHEAARIQGFPDFFNFNSVLSRNDLHTMIANAVPPKIMAMILNTLIKKGVIK